MSESKVSRRKFIGIGAGVAAAAIALGAGYTLYKPAAKNEVKIGVLAPLTGAFASLGLEQPENAELVIDKWNEKGGLLGMPITMVTRDTETNPEVATRRAKELITTEKVDFLTGTVSNGVQYAVMEVAREEQIPWMVGSGTTAPLKENGVLSRDAWYFYSDVQMFAKVDARYCYEELGDTAYIVAMDYVWGRLVTDYFKETFEELGGKVVGTDFAPIGVGDYVPFFSKIQDANPDLLVCPLGGGDMATMIKQANSYGLKNDMTLFGINCPTVRDAAGLSPEEEEGVYNGLQFYWEFPNAKEYSDEMMRRYNHPPDAWGYCVYAGLNELFWAIEKAGSLDRDAIRAVMEEHHVWNWGKGDCYFRVCDHQAIQPWHIMRGKSPDKITGEWDLLEIVKEYPANENEEYLPTCDELGY